MIKSGQEIMTIYFPEGLEDTAYSFLNPIHCTDIKKKTLLPWDCDPCIFYDDLIDFPNVLLRLKKLSNHWKLAKVSVVGIAEEQHYFQREPSQFWSWKKMMTNFLNLMTLDIHGIYMFLNWRFCLSTSQEKQAAKVLLPL